MYDDIVFIFYFLIVNWLMWVVYIITTHIFLYVYYISYKKDNNILLNYQILSVKNALKK